MEGRGVRERGGGEWGEGGDGGVTEDIQTQSGKGGNPKKNPKR